MATRPQDEWTQEEFLARADPGNRCECRVYEGEDDRLMVVLQVRDGDGEDCLLGEPTWQLARFGSVVAPLLMNLPRAWAQQVFDALWRAGLRPSDDEMELVFAKLERVMEVATDRMESALLDLAYRVDESDTFDCRDRVQRILDGELED